MSTITAVKKNGYVAIACDTLTKNQSHKDTAEYVTNHSKIIRIGDNFLGISGPTSGKLILADYFAKLKKKVDLSKVEAIFKIWIELHRVLKEEYHINPVEDENDSFESSRMDILLVNPHGIYMIGANRSVQELAKFYAIGMGDQYAIGAMYTCFDDKQKSAEDIARIGVQAAAEFDDATGLPVISYNIKLADKPS